MITQETIVSAKSGKTVVIEREETAEEIRAAMERSRLTAYRAEADPLFFKWQAGEATEQEWLDARQSVRDRYPYPEES